MKLKTVKILQYVLIGIAILCMALLYVKESTVIGVWGDSGKSYFLALPQMRQMAGSGQRRQFLQTLRYADRRGKERLTFRRKEDKIIG